MRRDREDGGEDQAAAETGRRIETERHRPAVDTRGALGLPEDVEEAEQEERGDQSDDRMPPPDLMPAPVEVAVSLENDAIRDPRGHGDPFADGWSLPP